MNPEMFKTHTGVIRELEKNHRKGYFVGGCVRDSFMGIIPKDIDIATDALVHEMKSIFPVCHETGAAYGTVTVRHEGRIYQITTFRTEEGYSDHRRPDRVAFNGSLQEDLSRRDFTINAMAFHPQEGLIDLFGGRQDIRDGVIRTVGAASLRFHEDALRILRGIRLSCELGFRIEEKTMDAMLEHEGLLTGIPMERTAMELKRCILSGHPGKMEILKSFALFREFSGVCLESMPREKDLALRLSFLLQGMDHRAIMERYRVKKETVRHVCQVLGSLPLPCRLTEYQLRRIMSQAGNMNAKRILLLSGRSLKLLKLIDKRGDCVRLKDLAVSGEDLLAEGITVQGKKTGEILEKLLDEVLKHPYMNDRETLLALGRGLK
ncbi:MAG: hypothetical protein R6W96_09280 [Clostridia bacterium]